MNRELTYIDPKAKIGKNVTISPFTSIYGDVIIGDNTWIGPNVTIMDGARIGKNCRIFPGAVISAIPQDLKFDGENTFVIIGDNVTIRECATINKGTTALGKTEIKENVLIMAYVHVAHDCIIGKNCILANSVQVAGHVEIGAHAIIGGTSAIHQFVKIGSHVMVSGGSLIRQDVPPYVRAAREPLSYTRIKSVGLRRRGFDDNNILELHEIYRYVYQKGHNNTKAIEAIEKELPATIERDMVLNFMRNSKRGLMKGKI